MDELADALARLLIALGRRGAPTEVLERIADALEGYLVHWARLLEDW